MSGCLKVSRTAAERACAEAVAAAALGVGVQVMRVDESGACVVGRWRGATPGQESVIGLAGAVWAGEDTGDADHRAAEAARFILSDPPRAAQVR